MAPFAHPSVLLVCTYYLAKEYSYVRNIVNVYTKVLMRNDILTVKNKYVQKRLQVVKRQFRPKVLGSLSSTDRQISRSNPPKEIIIVIQVGRLLGCHWEEGRSRER